MVKFFPWHPPARFHRDIDFHFPHHYSRRQPEAEKEQSHSTYGFASNSKPHVAMTIIRSPFSVAKTMMHPFQVAQSRADRLGHQWKGESMAELEVAIASNVATDHRSISTTRLLICSLGLLFPLIVSISVYLVIPPWVERFINSFLRNNSSSRAATVANLYSSPPI